eukprot:scaffold5560_cov444-Prasinococcus_capsulatus_cf.AAC.8
MLGQSVPVDRAALPETRTGPSADGPEEDGVLREGPTHVEPGQRQGAAARFITFITFIIKRGAGWLIRIWLSFGGAA